jgi:hypothetical protein
MEEVGLAHSAKRGRESVWRLDERRLQDARHYLEIISRQWEEKLSRLRAFVED